MTDSLQLESLLKEFKQIDVAIVKLSSRACEPCRRIHPCFMEFKRKKPQLEFVVINVDERDDILDCRVPTFLLVKNGKLVESFTGASSSSLGKLVARGVAIADAIGKDEAGVMRRGVSGVVCRSKK